jgi:heat shock protein 5
MARRSKGGSTPFAWTTVFYLLLVFIAPFALLQTARAQDEQAPLKEDLGTGTLPDEEPWQICGTSNQATEPVIGIDLGTTYS